MEKPSKFLSNRRAVGGKSHVCNAAEFQNAAERPTRFLNIGVIRRAAPKLNRFNRQVFCRFTACILCAAITVSLAACDSDESDGSDHTFSYDLSANPQTLDPQTAEDENALMVIGNIFDGLLRLDDGGNVIAGVASEYTVSQDGLVYTFILREDVYWSDKSGFEVQCTAHDFVFAFKRLFNPATKSKNARGYFCIKNSELINGGKADIDTLGVIADGDFKLTVTLDYSDVDFPLLLTGTPAMPCNEEFYINASGRYGLTEDAVPSNGAFYLRDWVYDPWWTDENRIILRRNEKNSENDTVFPLALNFYMDRENPFSQFTGNNSDCIVLSGDGAVELIEKGYPYSGAENSVWGITFNSSGAFSDAGLRKSLSLATDRTSIDLQITGYRKASGIVPDSIKIGDNFYRELAGSVDFPGADIFDPITSITATPVMIVPDDEAVLEFIGFITQQWQEKLSLFCKIEPLSASEYKARFESGDYDLAALKVSASYNNPAAVLEAFSGNNSRAADLVKQARYAATHNESAELFKQAETALVESADVIPVCFQTEYFFRSKKSEDLVYNPFTRTIVFREAKMY